MGVGVFVCASVFTCVGVCLCTCDLLLQIFTSHCR